MIPAVKSGAVSAHRTEKESADAMAAKLVPGSVAESAAPSEIHLAPESAMASGEEKALSSDQDLALDLATDLATEKAMAKALKSAPGSEHYLATTLDSEKELSLDEDSALDWAAASALGSAKERARD